MTNAETKLSCVMHLLDRIIHRVSSNVKPVVATWLAVSRIVRAEVGLSILGGGGVPLGGSTLPGSRSTMSSRLRKVGSASQSISGLRLVKYVSLKQVSAPSGKGCPIKYIALSWSRHCPNAKFSID